MASSKSSSKNQKKKKKKKRENDSSTTSGLSELKRLGLQLLSSRAHVNNLPLLLKSIKPSSPPQHALESILSLQSFFTPLLPQLPSSNLGKPSSQDQDQDPDPEFIYRTWVCSKFHDFVTSLIDTCVSPLSEQPLIEVVLDTLMECVKVGNGGKFHSAIYHRFIHSIVYSMLGDDLLVDLLVSKYFNYIDVRYFTYISLEKLIRTLEVKGISVFNDFHPSSDDTNAHADVDSDTLSRESEERLVQKVHHILSNIPSLEELGEESEYEMWNGLGVFTKEGSIKEHNELPNTEGKLGKTTKKSSNNVSTTANVPKKMKLKFTKAWISFLRLPLPVDVYKEVLVTLHQAVIPYLSNPIMLCDFLTRSYDIGGVISVMALSSLFVLMTEHGLESPNFYEKLYALLEPSIFIAKHRAKFFQLLDSCLKSPLLLAYLAASFAKKLSRLALSIPPSGDLVIIALIHNLLRRHPSINCLVHREDSDGTAKDVPKAVSSVDMSANKSGIDHFNNEETDLVKTNAMRSSLWEIDTLRHHYCPPVSRFVLSLENDLTVRAKTTEVSVEDFSSGSYATIFAEEIRRRVKQVPLAFYNAVPTSLFSESDFPGWTFQSKDGDYQADDNKKITNISEEHDRNSAKRRRIECS